MILMRKNYFSKLQKVIILYIGVITKSQNKKYMKMIDVSRGLKKHLKLNELYKDQNSFNITLFNSITSLKERKVVVRLRRCIGLTDKGREIARQVREEIIKKYGTIDWEKVRLYYGSKETE